MRINDACRALGNTIRNGFNNVVRTIRGLFERKVERDEGRGVQRQQQDKQPRQIQKDTDLRQRNVRSEEELSNPESLEESSDSESSYSELGDQVNIEEGEEWSDEVLFGFSSSDKGEISTEETTSDKKEKTEGKRYIDDLSESEKENICRWHPR